MLKTKIVCTIGPASQTREIIRGLVESGMSVARLNFSHGTHAEHLEKIRIIRTVSAELGKPIAILQDLGGPKIRVGVIPEPGVRLTPGQLLALTGEPVEGTPERVSVSYADLPREVRPGDSILMADGTMELSVLQTVENDIVCKVITGGVLTSHKGINLPSSTLSVDAMTPKDYEDLLFGLENDVDYAALSFVRRAEDIIRLKNIISEKRKQTPVIAKIEKHEALNNIEAIVAASDGIMVARGDLGVEIALERVPVIQKMLVKKANDLGKPVIIATQMLRSMVDSPRPTRAEAADVANAVLDGADAVMLSEETASGRFPVESVKFMVRIAENAEKSFDHERFLKMMPEKNISASVAYASCILADHLNAAVIVATTRSGFTAANISRFKPRSRLLALSPDLRTVRRLALYWGCIPGLVPETRDTDEKIEQTAQTVLKTGMVGKGDLAVITAGHPVWAQGTTNMLRVKQF